MTTFGKTFLAVVCALVFYRLFTTLPAEEFNSVMLPIVLVVGCVYGLRWLKAKL